MVFSVGLGSAAAGQIVLDTLEPIAAALGVSVSDPESDVVQDAESQLSIRVAEM